MLFDWKLVEAAPANYIIFIVLWKTKKWKQGQDPTCLESWPMTNWVTIQKWGGGALCEWQQDRFVNISQIFWWFDFLINISSLFIALNPYKIIKVDIFVLLLLYPLEIDEAGNRTTLQTSRSECRWYTLLWFRVYIENTKRYATNHLICDALE